jgi:cell division protein FtsX
VGHVDVSVFVADGASTVAVRRLRSALTALPDVVQVYFESRAQAVAEFRRLYTCSARVPAAQVPASFRLVLRHVSHPRRDDDVRTILALPGVDSVSCDPSDPCTDVTRASPSPS